MLSRDHNILWLPESNGYPTRTILGATLFRSFLCAQSCDLSRPRILGRFVGLVLV